MSDEQRSEPLTLPDGVYILGGDYVEDIIIPPRDVVTPCKVTSADTWAVIAYTLRAALREALDGWERAETEAIRATASEAQAEIDIANSEDLARIAELRKLT